MPQKRSQKNKLFAKISIIMATFCLVFLSGFSFWVKSARGFDYGQLSGSIGAGASGISVSDRAQSLLIKAGFGNQTSQWMTDWLRKQSFSEIFKSTLRSAVNTIAYDTATYLGSGGEGGKALWRKENMGTYLNNLADQTAGKFIEELVDDNIWQKYDICEPDVDFKIRIGLGLMEQERPEVDCSFTEMKNNWEQELQQENFLTNFSNVFYTNDFPGQKVIKLESILNRKKIAEQESRKFDQIISNGWNAFTGIARERNQSPGVFGDMQRFVYDKYQMLDEPTGHLLSDALEVFVNQLAYTLFTETMKNLGKDSPYLTSPYSGDYGGLEDYESDPGGISPNRQNVEEKTQKIVKPNFSIKGDYNALTELVMCPDPKNPATNECVIDNKFSQAVQEKLTVGEAMEEGYLNPDGIFGYKKGNIEPQYNQGYPHRSILILKKYRIVPVGWDLAAQYIKHYLNDKVSLEDLVSCYSPDDEWDNGYRTPGPADIKFDAPADWQLDEPSYNRILDKAGSSPGTEGEGDIRGPEAAGWFGGDWERNPAGDEPLINFGSNKEIMDSTGGTGGNYDGRIISQEITIPENAKTLSYWRHFKLESFDYHDGNPDAYYVEIIDAENPDDSTNVLKTIEKWESPKNSHSVYTVGPGYKSVDISDLEGKKIKISFQMVGNFGAENIEDGDFDSALMQIDDVSLGTTNGWCRGLVDPDWVLKAPLNYCQREGYGENHLMETVSGNSEKDSKIEVSRKEYCSDEQTCIKENSDGSCEYYGYCTRERREWNFDSESCNSTFNTCQTFRAREKGKVSYLKNTLDYEGCDENSVGCAEYKVAQNSAYTIASNTMDWASSTEEMYFNKNIQDCGPDEEGCREFLRVDEDSGGNFIYNSSFEDSGGFLTGMGDVVSNGYLGTEALHITSDGEEDIPVGSSVAGETYTLSFYAKNCDASGMFFMGEPAEKATSSFSGSETWSRYALTHSFPASVGGNKVKIGFNDPGSCYIDGVKLEKARQASGYTDYREGNTIYQKLLPEYMEADCYRDGVGDDQYQFRDSASSLCYNYARKCHSSEVGCNLYQEEGSDFEIPAQVSAQDRCPQECAGFDTYVQDETHFSSRRDEYFIPESAQNCNAQAAGCDEFTNLDKVEEGGEALEYYSRLRHCVQENDPDCATFYTWQGDAEEGQQLVSFSLKSTTTDTGKVVPDITSDEASASCEDIYDLAPGDPGYDSDCKEFYNRNGGVSYYLFSHTISCSDNCHAYRRTRINTVNMTNCATAGASDCDTADGDDMCKHDSGTPGDTTDDICIFCKNGGEWSSQHQGCIYQGIPGQGQPCSASSDGCREYNGNQGNNTRVILVDGFEAGREGWSGGSTSTDSLRTNERSYEITGSQISKVVGRSVREGNAYVLEFIADGTGDISAYLQTSGGTSTQFQFSTSSNSATLSGDDNWKRFKANIKNLDHTPTSTEVLVIESSGGANINIDNIKLTEITERYYLIKDTWKTPLSCHQDIYGNDSKNHMLGCSAYQDQDGDSHYLHQFTELCQESAVGCEVMIDTQNYEDRSGNTWGSVSVPADEFIYAVYDEDKKCNASELGCERFGEIYNYQDENVYRDVYLKNNPNRYNEILCEADDVGCEEWYTENGKEYFRDPGEQVCEYRQGDNGYSWYKKKVKTCSNNNEYCLSARDCELSGVGACESNEDCGDEETCLEGQCRYSCALEQMDIECNTEDDLDVAPKTLGKGGFGESVQQPEDDTHEWVGLCPASQSGCTEYIDPYSRVSPDLLSDRFGSGNVSVKIEPHTLYYDPDNVLSTLPNPDYVFEGTDLFLGSDNLNYYNGSQPEFAQGLGNDLLRKAVVNYTFASEVDESSCNGVYNYKKGCILFNERSYGSEGYKGLIYNASQTGEKEPPNNSDPQDSNALLKVQPDRDCDQWLACRSHIELDGEDESSCLDIGICDSLDKMGNCDNFIETASERYNHTLHSVPSIDNLSGYSKVAYTGGMNFDKIPLDLYNAGSMEQKGKYSAVYNGSFELYGAYSADNTQEDEYVYPFGWVSNPIAGSDWTNQSFAVINNPVEAQSRGLDYPVDGDSFLRYSSADNSLTPSSESVSVIADQEYYLSFRINTKDLGGDPGCKAFVAVLDGFNKDPLEVVEVNPGGDGWQLKMRKFTPSHSSVNIHLGGHVNFNNLHKASNCRGQVYIDDIRVEPVLEVNDYWKKRQSCRLYPEKDSLSCYYRDDGGYQYLGQKGYCLEYDHTPGNEDACLLWWPVDKVRGQIIEEDAGYDGRFPIYNCTEVNLDYELVERRKEVKIKEYEDLSFILNILTFHWSDAWEQIKDDPLTFLGGLVLGSLSPYNQLAAGMPITEISSIDIVNDPSADIDTFQGTTTPHGQWNQCYGAGCGECPFGYYLKQRVKDHMFKTNTYIYCTPLEEDVVTTDKDGNKWYSYNGDLQKIKHKSGDFFKESEPEAVKENPEEDPVKVYFHEGKYEGQLMNYSEAYNRNLLLPCDQMVRVVSGMGNAKPWTNRLSPDSKFMIQREGLDFEEGADVDLEITYPTPYRPYGSITEVDPPENPYEWDAIPQTAEKNPVNVGKTYDNYTLGGVTAGCEGETCRIKDNFGRLGVCSQSNQNCLAYSVYSDVVLENITNPEDVSTPNRLNFDGMDDAESEYNWANTAPYETYNLRVKYNCPKNEYCVPLETLSNEEMRERLKGVYVKSYGSWEWDEDRGHYVAASSSTLQEWLPPDTRCPGDIRPPYDPDDPTADFCAIPPEVNNIEVNGKGAGQTVELHGNGSVEISFNTNLNAEQIPITRIEIHLGNGDAVPFTNTKINEKNNPENPHQIDYTYNFNDLFNNPDITCGTTAGGDEYCDVDGNDLSILVQDNWDWCNNGDSRNDCDDPDVWEDGTIRVYEQ